MLTTLALAAALQATAPAAPFSPPDTVVRADWNEIFEAFDTRGAFLVHDEESDTVWISDEAGAHRRRIPASTFKIPNSLILLESETFSGVHDTIAWDGVDRGSSDWNRDHTMRTAFPVSAVWFYQEAARRLGPAAMSEWVARLDYGNGRIGPGSSPALTRVDRFWLDGPLAVSPAEQVDFLRRFYHRRLPDISDRSWSAVVEIMEVARSAEEESGRPLWLLRGKTGWAYDEARGVNHAWYVGWVERAGAEPLFFAVTFDGHEGIRMREAQRGVLRALLERLELEVRLTQESRQPLPVLLE